MTKNKAKANSDKANKAAKRALKDFLLIENSGLSRKSSIYIAARRELDRVADEQIAAREILNAIGTDSEKAELKYQELWKRLTLLNELMGPIADAGFSPDSSVWKAVEREAERVGEALNAADEKRAAIMRSKL